MNDLRWKEWLRSREAEVVFKSIAEQICRKFWDNPSFIDAYGSLSQEDVTETLKGEVWDILANQAGFAQILESGDATLLRKKMYLACLIKFKEKFRDPEYRYVREVLQESSEVKSQATADASWFSCGAGAVSIAHEDSRTSILYDSLPLPLSKDVKGKTKKSLILFAARFFWEEVCSRLGGDFFLPARELTRYLRARYPETFPSRMTTSIPEGEEYAPPSLQVRSGDPVAQVFRSQLDLAGLAESLSASLSPKQRVIASMLHEGKTLQEMAQILGLASPSLVHYHQKKLHGRIREFMILHLGVESSEDCPKLSLEFLSHVKQQCQAYEAKTS